MWSQRPRRPSAEASPASPSAVWETAATCIGTDDISISTSAICDSGAICLNDWRTRGGRRTLHRLSSTAGGTARARERDGSCWGVNSHFSKRLRHNPCHKQQRRWRWLLRDQDLRRGDTAASSTVTQTAQRNWTNRVRIASRLPSAYAVEESHSHDQSHRSRLF